VTKQRSRFRPRIVGPEGAAKMRLPSIVAAVVCGILLLSAPRLVEASNATSTTGPNALWVQPSNTWYVACPRARLALSCLLTPFYRYGIDGTWSNFMFAVGSPAQMVYLTVATALSEIWVVESSGCSPGKSQVPRVSVAVLLTRGTSPTVHQCARWCL
jgi:hypothetical protein